MCTGGAPDFSIVPACSLPGLKLQQNHFQKNTKNKLAKLSKKTRFFVRPCKFQIQETSLFETLNGSKINRRKASYYCSGKIVVQFLYFMCCLVIFPLDRVILSF